MRQVDGIAPAGVTHRAGHDSADTGKVLLPPPANTFQSSWDLDSSAENSRAGTPLPWSPPPAVPPFPLAQIQRSVSKHSFLNKRLSLRPKPNAAAKEKDQERQEKAKDNEKNAKEKDESGVERSKSSKRKTRISVPVPGSFVHANGAFMAIRPVSMMQREVEIRGLEWMISDDGKDVWGEGGRF